MTRFMSAPYEHYKDTETKWLGSIPAHWAVKRIKEEFVSLDYKRIPLSGEERQTMTGAIYDYYGASGIIDKVDNYIFDEPLILIGEDGANLLMRGSSLAFIARGKYWVNNHAHVLRPKKGKLEYLCYLLESFDYTVLISGSAQPKLTAGQLNNVLLMLPPLEEQQAIADYLDAKTAQIDRKIELLEQKAEKYADLKQSLINETVTHGLDKTVPMKDSGVKWIGQIAIHWEVKRIKDLFRGSKNKVGSKSSSYKILSLTQNGVLERDIESGKGKFPATFDGYQIVNPDSLLLCLFDMDVTPRIVGYVDQVGLVSSAYTNIIGSKDTWAKYFYFYFLNQDRNKSLLASGKGLRSTLTLDNFGLLKIPLPPFEEQKAIADYLESKTAHIEKIIETINLEVEKLKELRKTLINDVVTGKIKVY